MPAGEVILGTILEFVFYLLAEVIIERIGKWIRKAYYWVRKTITGKEREVPELKRIESRYLYKRFKLKSDFNNQILKGTRGTVLKVIDEQILHVEFEDANGELILEGDEQVFKVERKKIMLESRKVKSQKVSVKEE